MKNPVMVLNTSNKDTAQMLCARLVNRGITYTFALVGIQYTVTVAETDVNNALGGPSNFGEIVLSDR